MPDQTLTVLFTDVVGSTQLISSLDPRSGEKLMSDHLAMVRRELTRRRGREIKSLGDGVMATFCAARDGVECAVAIQRASARWIPRGCKEPLSIRIGVSSGDVSVESDDCSGTAVVEASRLCAHASGGRILLSERTRLIAPTSLPVAAMGDVDLKGLPEPTTVWEATWSPDTHEQVRAVLADDAVLMREGIAHVLEHAGIEVTGQAGDAAELLRLTAELQPDVAIIDLRMPPTHTDEGLRAAEEILAIHRATGVLVLSQDAEPRYAARLRAARSSGVGYLLKERVADAQDFAAATRSVANGACVFEPSLAEHVEART